MNDQEWNERIIQQNNEMIAEAERNHRIKQELKRNLIAALWTVNAEFPLTDDGLRDMPDQISDAFVATQRIIRQLGVAENVTLLGQDVDEFRVQLPGYIRNNK